jgi:hypothetical protein
MNTIVLMGVFPRRRGGLEPVRSGGWRRGLLTFAGMRVKWGFIFCRHDGRIGAGHPTRSIFIE